jgi:ribosome-associated protein
VREAGFPKPRIEGEDNGEWIIVDCGAAVAHIMQPAIRQYYHLEEIWGEKPIRLRLGAPMPAQPMRAPAPAAKKAPSPSLRRSSAVKTVEREASAAKKQAAAKQAAARKTAPKAGGKTTARTAAGQAALKTAAKKAPARKAPAAKPVVKKAPAKKAAPARKSPSRG